MMKLLEDGALLLNRYIVIADIHFGDFFVYDMDVLRSYKDELVNRIIGILEKWKVYRIIINGDLKESIGLPNKIVRELLLDFLNILLGIVKEMIVIKGNHDGRIEDIFSDVNSRGNYQIVKKLVIDDVILFHGHRKITIDEFSKTSTIITAHIHPAISLSPLRRNIKAWLIGSLKVEEVNENDVTWIVLPAFSEYTYGLALNQFSNQELLNLIPIKGTVKLNKATILLRDLTPLEEREIHVEE